MHFLRFRVRSPAAEARDLKSLKGGFESHRTYSQETSYLIGEERWEIAISLSS